MKGLQLLATGGALPGRVVTNEDLSRQVDTSDEWITTRTGIRQRYYCTESEDAATLAIAAARQAGALVSFDPNLRFPLWPDREALYRTVWEFLPQADILKVSDEELEFLTGTRSIEQALPALLRGRVQLVLYTCGGSGA